MKNLQKILVCIAVFLISQDCNYRGTDQEFVMRIEQLSPGIVCQKRTAKTVVDSLIDRLRSDDEQTREIAVEELVKLGTPEVVNKLIFVLKDDRKEEVEFKAVAELLNREDDSSVMRSLKYALCRERQNLGKAAVRILTKINSPLVVPFFAKLLIDTNLDTSSESYFEIQRAVIVSLGELKDPEALPALENVLKRQDKHYNLQVKSIVKALGQIGGPKAFSILAKLLFAPDMDSLERDAIAKALVEIGDLRALPLLRKAYCNDSLKISERMSGSVYDSMYDKLVEIGHSLGLYDLVELLTDRDPYVREAALIALGGMDNSQGIEDLTKLFNDENWYVLQAAKKVYNKLLEMSAFKQQRAVLTELLRDQKQSAIHLLLAV